MWLWKKFCNTDIIGKIIILVLLFIIVVATITVVTRYKNASIETQSNAIDGNNMESDNTIIENNIAEYKDNTDTDNDVIQIATNMEKTIETNNNQETNRSDSKKSNTQQNSSTNQGTKQGNNGNSQKTQTNKQKAQSNNDKKNNEKAEKVKEQTQDKKKQETTKELGEKYIINENMINRIRQVIQNNESEYMMKYGYNIVVDSSIKELTNQFTFTESRVINMIKFKFGTIRIYAEDYYRNGQLIMTECYVI